MTTHLLIEDLKRDEGCRLTAYKDTVGVWTVGVGHAHVEPGTVWTQAQANAQLAADIAHIEASLDVHLPWWRTLDDVRQDVIANMAFNLGVASLMTFGNTLGHVKRGEWELAAEGMLASKWAAQVHGRAMRLAEQMRTGVHQS